MLTDFMGTIDRLLKEQHQLSLKLIDAEFIIKDLMQYPGINQRYIERANKFIGEQENERKARRQEYAQAETK